MSRYDVSVRLDDLTLTLTLHGHTYLLDYTPTPRTNTRGGFHGRNTPKGSTEGTHHRVRRKERTSGDRKKRKVRPARTQVKGKLYEPKIRKVVTTVSV